VFTVPLPAADDYLGARLVLVADGPGLRDLLAADCAGLRDLPVADNSGLRRFLFSMVNTNYERFTITGIFQ